MSNDRGRLMRNVAVTVDHDAYRRAICAICDTEEEVVEQVCRTVIHEVADHFGIDDARLDELGW